MLGRIVIAFIIAALLFWGIEGIAPAPRGRGRDARDWATDLIYWFLSPLVTKAITAGAVGLVVVLGARFFGVTVTRESGLDPLMAVRWSRALPLWQQALGVVLLMDFSGYWLHRLFHRRRLWPFHAVHHSSTTLDWLAAGRVHPVNDLLTRLLQAAALIVVGFDPRVVAGVVPFFSLHAIFIHAAVTWDFGPLRYVISSPAFHRWHHSSQAEGLDKNFAGLLPLWDLLFGTFHMPRGRPPEHFGVHDPVPRGVWRQLWWPFSRAVRRDSSLC